MYDLSKNLRGTYDDEARYDAFRFQPQEHRLRTYSRTRKMTMWKSIPNSPRHMTEFDFMPLPILNRPTYNSLSSHRACKSIFQAVPSSWPRYTHHFIANRASLEIQH